VVGAVRPNALRGSISDYRGVLKQSETISRDNRFGRDELDFGSDQCAGYVILKQGHYQNAVASVREMCDHRPIALTPSSMNWEFDLRDDNLRMTTNSAPAQPECAVNFDNMMIMKKYVSRALRVDVW